MSSTVGSAVQRQRRSGRVTGAEVAARPSLKNTPTPPEPTTITSSRASTLILPRAADRAPLCTNRSVMRRERRGRPAVVEVQPDGHHAPLIVTTSTSASPSKSAVQHVHRGGRGKIVRSARRPERSPSRCDITEALARRARRLDRDPRRRRSRRRGNRRRRRRSQPCRPASDPVALRR